MSQTQQLCEQHRHEIQDTVAAAVSHRQGSPGVTSTVCPVCRHGHNTIYEHHRQEPGAGDKEDDAEIVVKLRPAKFADKRLNVLCPHCKELVTTDLNLVDGAYVWYTAGCMFLAGFCLILPWFCCCVPFIADTFKDVEHYCPNCCKLIHVVKRVDKK